MVPGVKYNNKYRGIAFSCLLLGFILSACGDVASSSSGTTPVDTTGSQTISPLITLSPATPQTSVSTSQSTAAASTGSGKTINQPKVIRVANDGMRTNITFTEIPILNSGVPVFLFFDAEGCPYCAQMQPIIIRLKQDYGARVVFGDLDFYAKQNASLVQQFKILGHPGFVLLDGQGKLVQRWIGVTPANTIENSVKSVLAK